MSETSTLLNLGIKASNKEFGRYENILFDTRMNLKTIQDEFIRKGNILTEEQAIKFVENFLERDSELKIGDKKYEIAFGDIRYVEIPLFILGLPFFKYNSQEFLFKNVDFKIQLADYRMMFRDPALSWMISKIAELYLSEPAAFYTYNDEELEKFAKQIVNLSSDYLIHLDNIITAFNNVNNSIQDI